MNPIKELSDFDEYQKLALRTASPKSTESELAMLTSAALGLSGESGEIADHVKKIVYHGHPLDDDTRDKIAKEIGDILWYCAIGSRGIGIDLGEIARMNVGKLRKRYPSGFSTEESINRPNG